MKLRHVVMHTGAAVVPLALVLGSTGTALAAKPVRTPAPTVTSTPPKASSSTSAGFVWTEVSGTTYACSLDGSAYAGCTSPASYSGLADRLHTFALRARAGTGKPATYSYSWTVDTVAPAAPVVAPIAGPTSNTNASVSFTDADTSVAGFACALDGAAAVACTSPHAYSGLGQGPHTVVVAAHDAAGNLATGSVSWTVDSLAPNIPVLTGPADPTNNPLAGVSFTGEGGATFSCALDGAVATSCVSPWAPATPLADGTHVLSVTAVDAAGNGATGSVSWVVDTTPPAAPALVSAPATTTDDPAFTVRFARTDLSTASYVCTFLSVTAACSSPWAPALPFTPVDGTSYSVQVRAVDLAGNQSAPLTASWTYDTTAPSPAAFLSGPDNPTNVTDPVFDFVDTDTSTVGFSCAVDASAYVGCSPAVALSTVVAALHAADPAYPAALPGDGSHTFHVTATDGVNTSASVDWSWVLDTTAPVLQPSTPPGGLAPGDLGAVTSTPTITFANPDPSTVAGFVCSLDGGGWTACSSGITPSVGDGTHTLQVATVDQAGNQGAPVSYTWTLDTVAPVGVLGFPATLTTPFTVTFPEPVLGVSTSTVRLFLAGTTTVVPTAQRCVDGTTVACSGAVRAVVLTPTARLVPGQRYRVLTGTAVHDLAGNPASSPATVFRALRVLQESQAAIGQGWAPRTSTAAYGGRYAQAHFAGDVLTYAFRGTAITWYTATGPAMGTVRVYCGSTLKSTVNDYAARTTWHVARTVRCSSTTASNVLKLVATGRKGATAGTGTGVVLDAVKVGATLTANPATTQRWAPGASTLASGGRFAYADLKGESAMLVFRGTSITWRTLLGKGMGKAAVYVDGVLKGTYDQFATTTKAASRTWRLTDRVHTLRVVVTGTHRAGATGNRVVVDLLTVG